MLTHIAVAGYRSLRDVRLALGRLTVVTGPNGSGKSSLYRALGLLREVSLDRVVPTFATEGGFVSALWAGPEQFSREMKAERQPVQGLLRKNPYAIKLGFQGDEVGFAVDFGRPVPQKPPSWFADDPHLKVEALWAGPRLRTSALIAERRGPLVQVRAIGDKAGTWRRITADLAPFDSMLSVAADPQAAPELLRLRERMRGWRFYDQLRTDRDAPARRPSVATYTPIFGGDGADLVAAVATIREIGDADGLERTIADAFQGATLELGRQGAYLTLSLRQYGLLRPLALAELSDGTLRYLMLAAALLTPRPPELIVLNEPETSLHPELMAPLARLIVAASAETQILVVSHAAALVTALEAEGAVRIGLSKQLGETVADGQTAPDWSWPSR